MALNMVSRRLVSSGEKLYSCAYIRYVLEVVPSLAIEQPDSVRIFRYHNRDRHFHWLHSQIYLQYTCHTLACPEITAIEYAVLAFMKHLNQEGHQLPKKRLDFHTF